MSEKQQLTFEQIAAIEWFREHPGISYIHLNNPDFTIWSPKSFFGEDIQNHPKKAQLFCEAMGIEVYDPDFEVGDNVAHDQQ
jgi:hypothetical protein